MDNKHRVGWWVCTQSLRAKDTSRQHTRRWNCTLRGPRQPGRAHGNRLLHDPSRQHTRYYMSLHCAHRWALWLCRRAGKGLCIRGFSLSGTKYRDCCAPCGLCHKQDHGPGHRWAVVANIHTGYIQIYQKWSGRLVVWVCIFDFLGRGWDYMDPLRCTIQTQTDGLGGPHSEQCRHWGTCAHSAHTQGRTDQHSCRADLWRCDGHLRNCAHWGTGG